VGRTTVGYDRRVVSTDYTVYQGRPERHDISSDGRKYLYSVVLHWVEVVARQGAVLGLK
jgi:hypothetical protein